MDYLVLLGGGIMQKPVFDYCQNNGIYCIILDMNSDCLLSKEVDNKQNENCEFFNIDISDKDLVYKFASSLKDKNKISGIITVGTDFSRTVSYVGQNLGLSVMPYSSAINCSIKTVMRDCFIKNGVNCPNYKEITCESDLNNIDLKYPLVVKPVDSMGARGTKLVYNFEELNFAYKVAKQYSKMSLVIVEEYIDEDYCEYSIDSIVYNNEVIIKGFAIRHIKYHPYFIEIGHTIPYEDFSQDSEIGALDKQDYDIIYQEFKKGVFALGINIGCAKGDVFYSKKHKKVMIGEIAGRLSGGFMSGWTYPYSSGDSVVEDAILIALGKSPTLNKSKKTWTCAERAIISIDGKISRIINNNLKIEDNGKNINYLHLISKQGDEVSFPQNNVQKCGNFIYSSADRKQTIEFCQNYISNIFIKLDNKNQRTIDYLTTDISKNQWAYKNLKDYLLLSNNSVIIDRVTIEKDTYLDILNIPNSVKNYFQDTDWSFRSLEKTIYTFRELYGIDICFNDKLNNFDRVFLLLISKAGFFGASFFFEEFLCSPVKYFNILLGVKLD